MKKKIKNKKELKKYNKLNKTWYGKLFYFFWYEDSMLSWIANILLAFIIIKYIFYPALSLIFGTSLPVVAVVSCSMEHGFTDCANQDVTTQLCGHVGKGRTNFNEYWNYCGNFYEERNITKEKFKKFKLSSGFNRGDIIFLKGVNIKKLKIGEIIVFDSNNRAYPIIHRIIKKELLNNEYVIQTKGDHNFGQINDGFLNEHNIREEKLIGKALFKVPYLGYVKIWFADLLNLIGIGVR